MKLHRTLHIDQSLAIGAFALFLYITLGALSAFAQPPAPPVITAAPAAIAPLPPQEPFLRIEIGEHMDAVRRIAATTDGSLVATTSDDKTIRLWHMPEGAASSTLRIPIGDGLEGKLYALAMSPDGSALAASGNTGLAWDGLAALYIFDVKAAKLRGRLPRQPDFINSLAYSPDGHYLAAVMGGKAGLRIWDVPNYNLVFSDTQYGGSGTWVAFAPDGRLATAAADGQIRLYAADFKLLAHHAAPGGAMPYSLAFAPDGEMLAVGQFKKPAVDILSARTLKPLYRANTKDATTGNLAAVAWTGHGQDLALWAGGLACQKGFTCKDKHRFIRRWSNAGKGSWLDIPVSREAVNALQEIPGAGLGFAYSDPGWGILDASTGKMVLNHTAPLADFRSLYIGRFGASADGTQVEFGVEFGGKNPFRFDTKHRTLQTEPPLDPSFKHPLTAVNKHEVRNWQDQAKPRFDKHTLKLEQGDTSRSAALSQDGKILVIGGEYRIYLFKGDAKPAVERGTTAPVWGVTITQDGRTAIAASGDGTLRWYSLLPGRELELLGSLFLIPDRNLWIAWTPEGFFAHSENGGQNFVGFHLNRGPKDVPVFANFSQVYAALYHPDLVSAKLAGTPPEQFTTATKAAASFIDSLRQQPVPKARWLAYCPAPTGAPVGGRGFARTPTPASPPISVVKTAPVIAVAPTATPPVAAAAPVAQATPAVAIAPIAQATPMSATAPIAPITPSTLVAGPNLDSQCQTIDGAARGFARIAAATAAPATNTSTAGATALTTALTKVLVRFEVQDEGGGVKDIDLFQNGLLVGHMSPSDAVPTATLPPAIAAPSNGAVAKPQPLTLERIFALQPGENNLEIRAFNKLHASSRSPLLTLRNEQPPQVVAPSAAVHRNRLFLVSIGINQYPSHSLTYAVADARETMHAIQKDSQGVFDEIKLIERYDGNANNEGLKALFKELAGNVHNGDNVVMYIAAHGALDKDNQYLLVTPDAVTEAGDLVDDKALGQTILMQALGQIQAAGANLFLMLDTCYSGALKISTAKISAEQVAGQLQNSTGIMTLAGATGYQEAYDNFKNSGHGLLAYTALRGLQGDLHRKPGDETVPAEIFARWVRDHAGVDASDMGLDKSVDLHKSDDTNSQDFPLLRLQPVANAAMSH